jgi:hypothetical protein
MAVYGIGATFEKNLSENLCGHGLRTQLFQLRAK